MSLLDLLGQNANPLAGTMFGGQQPISPLASLMPDNSPPREPWDERMPQPHDPFAGVKKKPGLFGNGGTGWGILGILGDALRGASGQSPIFAPYAMQQRQQERELQIEEQRMQREEAARARRRQVVPLGDGGVGTWSDEGGFEILREPTPDAPKATALEQQVEYLRRLNPKLTDEQAFQIAQRGIGGFQYSPEGIAARVQGASSIADAQGAARARYRAPAGGGGGGRGGSLTANQRAKIIGEGRAAIAKGADPAKVQARMRELGVE